MTPKAIETIIKKNGSLLTNYPEVAKEWCYERNDMTPDKVTKGSHSSFYWKCSRCGTIFQCKVETKVRFRNGYGCCPKCSKEAQIKTNIKNRIKNGQSLLDYSPVLCMEWDYENNEKSPNDYTPFSSEKVFWVCSICGHSYKSSIRNRTRNGNGCSRCKMPHGERIIKCFLDENKIKYLYQYKFNDCVSIRQLPFDFYLPDFNIAIEYDGSQHYKPIDRFGGVEAFEELKKRDKIKDDYCKEHGIKLIRLTEKNPDKLFEILHNTIFANK